MLSSSTLPPSFNLCGSPSTPPRLFSSRSPHLLQVADVHMRPQHDVRLLLAPPVLGEGREQVALDPLDEHRDNMRLLRLQRHSSDPWSPFSPPLPPSPLRPPRPQAPPPISVHPSPESLAPALAPTVPGFVGRMS
eukprot:717807-Hanusia_phi.AAC.2